MRKESHSLESYISAYSLTVCFQELASTPIPASTSSGGGSTLTKVNDAFEDPPPVILGNRGLAFVARLLKQIPLVGSWIHKQILRRWGQSAASEAQPLSSTTIYTEPQISLNSINTDENEIEYEEVKDLSSIEPESCKTLLTVRFVN